MTVLRWILSYLGVIVILIAVVLGYVYRQDLMAWFDASDRQLARTSVETGGTATESAVTDGATPEDTAAEGAPTEGTAAARGVPSDVPAAEQAEPRAEKPAIATQEPAKPAEATPQAPLSVVPPEYAPSAPSRTAPVARQPATADMPASTQEQAPGAAPEAPPPVAAVSPRPPEPKVTAPSGEALTRPKADSAPPVPPKPSPAAQAAEAGTAVPARPMPFSTPAAGADSATPAPRMAHPMPPPGDRIPRRPAPPVYAESWSSSRVEIVPRRYGRVPPPRRSYPTPPGADAAIGSPPPLADEQRAALRDAREAFWSQGPEAAASLYEAVAEANPDNPDIRGELANVYFTMGERSQATEAYARVVILLHQQGRRGEAARVLRMVAMLDRARAQELSRELGSAPSASGESGETR